MIVPADTTPSEPPTESAADLSPPATAAAAPAPEWRARLYLYAALFILGFVILVRIYPPEIRHFLILDHLDGNFPRYVILSQLPLIGGLDDTVPQLLGGVPRNSMPSSLTVYSLLFRLVPPPWVLVLNEVLMRVAALFGMWLLLRGHLLRGLHPFGAAGTALAFALLPFWPPGCLCIAGQPLLFWALLNLRAGRLLLISLLIVALFPFFSLLVMIGWVIVLVCGAMILEAMLRRNWRAGWLVLATTLLIAGYVLVEYRLLYQAFLNHDYVSHRSSFTGEFFTARFRLASYAWQIFSGSGFGSFLFALAVQFPLLVYVFPLVLGTHLVYLDLRKRMIPGGPAGPEAALRLLLGCIAMILLGTAVFVFQHHPGLRTWLLRRLPGALATLDFSRIGWLTPTAWYIGLGACTAILFGLGPRLRAMGILILVGQCVVVGVFDLARQRPGGDLTYAEFYSTPLFDEIRTYIGRPQGKYRVASIAMIPGIAQYNGFYTADGYMPDYPLEYKQRFRRVIAKRLEADEELRTVFDAWGSKCYLFVGDFPQTSQRNNRAFFRTEATRPRQLTKVDLDIEALVDLDVEYVFSAYRIADARSKGLRPITIFTDPDSPWTVHLYRTRIGKETAVERRGRLQREREAAQSAVPG